MVGAQIIARLLQSGTRQGQKAAAALLRMLKKSNPSGDIVRPRAFVKQVGSPRKQPLGDSSLSTAQQMQKKYGYKDIYGHGRLGNEIMKQDLERAGMAATNRLAKGVPTGIKAKDTIPGVRTFNPEKGMSTRAIAERAAFDRLKTPPAMRGLSNNMREYRDAVRQGPRNMNEMDRFPARTISNRNRSRGNIMGMRQDPGMARGLQRMESRKASALNTPEGRALRYEPSIRRTANFNKLIVEDKGFRRYLRNMMGDKSGDVDLGSISPRMQDYLAKGYLSLERRLKIKGFR